MNRLQTEGSNSSVPQVSRKAASLRSGQLSSYQQNLQQQLPVPEPWLWIPRARQELALFKSTETWDVSDSS